MAVLVKLGPVGSEKFGLSRALSSNLNFLVPARVCDVARYKSVNEIRDMRPQVVCPQAPKPYAVLGSKDSGDKLVY